MLKLGCDSAHFRNEAAPKGQGKSNIQGEPIALQLVGAFAGTAEISGDRTKNAQ